MKKQPQDRAVTAAAIKAAKKLEEAAQAVNAYLSACLQAGHADLRGIGDSRRILIEDISEYACHLNSVYQKP